MQKKVTFPHWSKKFSALFWVLSTSLSCAESSPSIRKGNSCSIWLWKSKFHVQKIIPCPCSPLFWISVFLWKFLNSVGPHGPTSLRNFHKNTSNQKRGELVQGKLFCTVTFLFHTSNWAGKVYLQYCTWSLTLCLCHPCILVCFFAGTVKKYSH